MRKCPLSILFALCAVLVLLPAPALAWTVDSGECGADGGNLTWTLDSNGTLTIRGTGRMTDSSSPYDYAPWFNHYDAIRTVEMENGITNIGDLAFIGCGNLTDVTIPDSVTRIGRCAFESCVRLPAITIPENVTDIGDYAFSDCTVLESITIPDNVTSIGFNAFWYSGIRDITVGSGNPNYRSIDGVLFSKDGTSLILYPGNRAGSYDIPDHVVRIEKSAFYCCKGLTGVTIPDSVTRIRDYAFYFCTSLTDIAIPDSVTDIGDHAFDGCTHLTGVTLPDSITRIADYTFYLCYNMTTVTIPDSVTSIGEAAFANCEWLTDITIPDSVTSIGDGAFANCVNLTGITIPNRITTISDYAFIRCESLTAIIVPDSVTSISGSAFDECGNLAHIYYAGSEEQWLKSGGPDQFDGCTATIHYDFTAPVTTVSSHIRSAVSLVFIQISNFIQKL